MEYDVTRLLEELKSQHQRKEKGGLYHWCQVQ